MKKMTLASLLVLSLSLVCCAEKEPGETAPEEVKYENAYPAKLSLPSVRDEFGRMDLTWQEGDVASLVDRSGKTVGRLEMVSGSGNTTAVFQIWTDLTSGEAMVRFGGEKCRIAPGFIAESEFFQVSPRMTNVELSIPVSLLRVKLSAAKGSKMFGTEFNSLKLSGSDFNIAYTAQKPFLVRYDPCDILLAVPSADLSGKEMKCTLKTYHGTQEMTFPGMDFRKGELSTVRILASSEGWEVFNQGCAPETYTYPAETAQSELYSVSVGGKVQGIYPTQDSHICAFGTDKSVKVVVTSSKAIESFSVRPLNKGYKAVQLDSRTIAFEIEPFGRASVELNGSIDTPLFVFANALSSVYEEQAAGISDLKRVRAGEVLKSSFTLKSGQGLLVEGGGVMLGKLITDGSGIKVLGGGIIDSWEDFSENFGVKINCSTDVTVSGVSVVCNTGRAFWTYNSSGLVYDNVKVIGASAPSSDNRQTDAMDLYGVRNAKISRCFCFSNDDTYCIKTWKWGYKAETNFVDFEDCIAWNYRGNGFEIGYETGLDVHDITYKNIYSLRSSCGRAAAPFRRGAVSIHGAASGKIYNVSYDGVFIEDPWEGGIDMRILKSGYELGTGETWGPGTISGVTMKNVRMEKMPVEGQTLLGYDATHRISLIIENLEIAGQRITSASSGKFSTNNYVDFQIN